MSNLVPYNGTHTGADIDSTITEVTNARGNSASLNGRFAELQNEIDQIVISASAEAVVAPEVAAARVSEDGTAYSTLKERLDAQNVGLSKSVNNLYSEVSTAWITNATNATGWKTGSSNAVVGDTFEEVANTNYISSVYFITATRYSAMEIAKAISITPPAGYSVRVIGVDVTTNKITETYGQVNTQSYPELAGKTVIFNITANTKYYVSLGRFSGDAGDHLDVGASATLKFIIPSAQTSAVPEYFTPCSENLIDLPNGTPFYLLGLNVNIQNGRITIKGTGSSDGYIKLTNGIVAAKNSIPASWLAETVSNLLVNHTYAYKQVNIKPDANNNVGLRLYDQAGNYVFTKKSRTEKKLTTAAACWVIRVINGQAVDYDFIPVCAEGTYSEVYLSELSPAIKTVASGSFEPRTGNYEFFTVNVERPLPFGDETQTTGTEEVECVLRLPVNYSQDGEPCRLVLACHGASGYIQYSTSTWYNENWEAFIDELLAAGYACFDSNVLPTSLGTDIMGRTMGSPLYVNVLKKAYDYITRYYNVKPQIIVHGTSMGGVGASAFCHAYPELVLCQSSFAGRDITQYLYQILNNSMESPDDFAKVFGYTDYAELLSDKFSHVECLAPSLSLKKYTGGVLSFPPDRETEFNAWLTYYAEIQAHQETDTIGDVTARRIVPYKSWNSWEDNENRTKAELILHKAYTASGSAPYYCVVYDEGTHTEISYGQINNMIDQLVAWYKRWE